MVALAYDDLGGISGVVETPKVPASKRSRDQNNTQRIAFECDPVKPFTGTIHVQASIGDPSVQDQKALWFDLAELVINNEGGSWSYEPNGEFSSIRVVCRDGDYWSAAHGAAAAVIGAGIVIPEFTINGITVTVNAGDTAAVVAAAITGTPGLDALNVFADVIDSNSLRIYKTDGADLVLADTSETPLADMGITPGTFKGGVITAIRSLR